MMGVACYVWLGDHDYHVGVNVCLPVESSLHLEVLNRSIKLKKAWFNYEHTSIPLLEDLLGCHSLQNHSTEIIVHNEEWRKTVHLSRCHSLVSFTSVHLEWWSLLSLSSRNHCTRKHTSVQIHYLSDEPCFWLQWGEKRMLVQQTHPSFLEAAWR